MSEENQSVEAAVETAEVSQPEVTQPVEPQEETVEQPTEPVDEAGVPVKNRIAEAQRKARKLAEAQSPILNSKPAEPQTTDELAEAKELVRSWAKEIASEEIAPIKVKQFLLENPEAVELVEDMNRIRTEHPELKSVEHLDLVFKIAKADRQEEIIRKATEERIKAQKEQQERHPRQGWRESGDQHLQH